MWDNQYLLKDPITAVYIDLSAVVLHCMLDAAHLLFLIPSPKCSLSVSVLEELFYLRSNSTEVWCRFVCPTDPGAKRSDLVECE